MAINLKFDLIGNPEPPSIVLANRNGNKLGQLNVNVDSIDVSDKFNAASEFSFTLNKYIDDEPTPLWDKVVDFKLVYCPEWDLWFEIKVELDEATETVKTAFCTQLGQVELSQIKVYNIHINEEGDPNWDTNNEAYKSTILYDKEHTDISLLHRLLKDKAPHYSIAYVDESIQRIQKSFSFDDTSICDAFDEISEEIGCLFVYNSNSTKGGKPNRTISVYDLQQNCKDCGHRGEFTDKCPKCGSINIKYGYGEDTTIFVTSDELATEGIQLVTDVDSVKNCFKLEGGDDLMTATIRNCNPNGSDYIWYFSDALKEDMSDELVEKLESYDEKYQYYYNEYISKLNADIVDKYNKLVEDFDADGNLVDGYSKFYDTKSTCLNCGKEDYFEKRCPNCGSENILSGQKLQTISTEIKGYPKLMTAYYNTIDLLLYLKSGLMPNVEIGEKSLCLDCNYEGVFAKVCPKCNSTNILSGAKYQLHLLNTSFPSTVAVNVDDVGDVTLPTADSAVLSMAKVIIKSTYKVEVLDDSSYIDDGIKDNDGNVIDRLWTGKFKITNYSDEDDYATSEEIVKIINNDTETFIKQKINKALNKENTDDYSVTGLFAKELNVNESGEHILDENGVCQGAETLSENGDPVCPFCAELKKYALNPLVNFSKVCDGVISILTEQGVGDDGGNIVVNNEDDELEKETKKALYDALYKPYYEKQQAINKEIATRENEIAIIEGVWDKSDENNPKCTTWGLQQYIEERQQYIQEKLDFEKHLGENLWLEFCAYRREDKYSNSNYVSDGLNNAELFDRALEFIEIAEEEIFKSAELQHSLSATLNNLLSLPKFKPLLKSFKTGNWIRVQVDDKVYKLRLLEYSFGYGDFESISVEFSDVTKIKNGVTDVKEVLEQASSMASSYDSVQRQAEKGNVARSTIDQWLVDGLNTANVQITSNDSEEVLLTKNGLLARSYDDITGTYLPEQLKITHNIMAYTDDNWKTVSSALGKHDYKKWENNQWVTNTDYGLSSRFVTAGYVTGSQIIGGEIVSSNYETGDKPVGTYINLINGNFNFAGGKIIYEYDPLTEKNNLTLSGVEIKWDSVNKPTIENIDGLSGITADIRAIEQGLGATTINGQYVISPHIAGGDLKIIGDNGVGAQISNAGVLTATGADITGDITATSLTLGKGVKISTENIDGIDEYAKIGDIEGIPDNIITTDDIAISESTTANGVTTQIITVGDKEYTNIISGDFIFTDIGLGTDTTDGSERYTCISKDGLLTAKNAVVYGTIYATAGEFTGSIKAGSTLYVGEHTDEDGNVYYNTWIDTDGVLHTNEAHINGTITAIDGMIGGFNIEPTIIEEGVVKAGGTLWSGELQEGQTSVQIGDNKSIFLSATNMGGTMPFYSQVERKDEDGNTIFDENDEAIYDTYQSPIEMDDWRITVGTNFGVTSDGTAYMSNCEIVGGSLRMGTEGDGYHTWISSDGVLNASGANIDGTINAVNGHIANWNINQDGIDKKDEDGNPIVGMHSGNDFSYMSFIENNTSPIRFYAGKLGTKTEDKTATLTFTSTGEELIQTITLSEVEQEYYKIIGAKCLTTNKVHSASKQVNINYELELDGTGLTYEKTVTIDVCPSWIPASAITYTYESISGLKPQITYNEGKCTLYSYYLVDGETPDPVEGILTFSYEFDETLDIALTYNDTSITAVFNPQSTDATYNIDIQYTLLDSKGRNFMVLEDGSLYASAVNITGTINATNGSFTGEVKADTGFVGGLKIQSNGIFSGDDGLSFDKDGIVKTQQLHVADNFVASTIRAGSIKGRYSDAVSLNFEQSDIVMEPVSFTTEINIIEQGSNNWFGNMKEAGSAQIKLIANKQLTETKTVRVQLVYSGNNTFYDSVYITIGAGNHIGSVTVANRVQYGAGLVLSGAIAPSDIEQPSSKMSVQNIGCQGGFVPTETDSYILGDSGSKWKEIWCTQQSAISTSDRNEKNSIESLPSQYDTFFDQLIPVRYKFNHNESNRFHVGFIAQDVKEALDIADISSSDFAGYISFDKKDGSKGYGLRYSEFIALNTYEIQKLKKRITELESQLK